LSPRPRILVAIVIALLGFVTPIVISLQLAWNESVADEKATGAHYAGEVVRRGEEAGRQIGRAVDLLNHDHFARCSPQEIELMRALDLGSSYVQMVGRISGNTLECTSMGTSGPLELGPPTLTTEHGVDERLNFQFGPVGFDKLDVVSRDGVAVVVDSNLLVDFDTEGEGVQLALMVPSSPNRTRLVQTAGKYETAWFNPVGRGQTSSYLSGPWIVSHVRSSQFDLEGVSAVPSSFAYKRVWHFAIRFVPIGCLCGIGLSGAVMYLSRNRRSLPGLLRAAARHKAFFVE